MIKSVDRALKVLDILKHYPKGLGVTELANQLDVAKSTSHRLLASLEEYGYVQKADNFNTYRMGLKFLEMQQFVIEQLDIVELAHPILDKLSHELEEIVHLVMLDGNEIVYIDKVDKNSSTIRIYSQIGKRAPLHCTGVGKAILAYYDSNKLESFFNTITMNQFTKNTLSSQQNLVPELSTIRNQRYAMDNEEHEIGIRCIAAPVFNHIGEVQFAISATGPISRMDNEVLKERIPLIQQAAKQISKKLGYTQ